MAKVNLYTTLSTIQEHKCDPEKRFGKRYFIQRGATATFSLDFSSYEWSDVRQVTFLFKQGKTVFSYEAISYIDESWELNEYFSLVSDLSSLILKLPPEITKQFKVTEGEDDLVRFEIVVQLYTNPSNSEVDTDTLIEMRPPIKVFDSIIADI